EPALPVHKTSHHFREPTPVDDFFVEPHTIHVNPMDRLAARRRKHQLPTVLELHQLGNARLLIAPRNVLHKAPGNQWGSRLASGSVFTRLQRPPQPAWFACNPKPIETVRTK